MSISRKININFQWSLFLRSLPQAFMESKMGPEKLWNKEEGNEGPKIELKSTAERESQSM